jgi:hypothetical protein
LTRSLRRATSPRKLLELDRDPDQILPGYGALVRRWSQRQQEVASDRLKSRMEAQNRRRRLRETTAIPISFDLDATLGDLGLDAPVQSEAQEPVPADAESTVEAPRTSEEVTSGKGRRTSQPQDDGAPKSQGVSACWLGTVFGLGATGVAVAVLLARLRLRRRRMK